MLPRVTAVAMLLLAFVPAVAQDYRVIEIARGQTWASPYWGYSTPKILSDGQSLYTAGMWGTTPETAEGVLYKLTGDVWNSGTRLPEIYQPATLALDAEKRLIVAYNRSDKPIMLLRSKTPGSIDDFEMLPAPPDMPNAYYIGIAIRQETLYVAYIVTPTYTMYLARLDLTNQTWSPSTVVAEGQVDHKPKTAWTYPILWPDETGLYFVASNAPDGGDGNSYNQIWYLFYPDGAGAPSKRELVAECPMGHFAYAMDMAVDPKGTVHIVALYNQRKYGDPLPPGSEEEGLYHFYRGAGDSTWRHDRIGALSLAGLRVDGDTVRVIAQDGGAITSRTWNDAGGTWTSPEVLIEPKTCPSPTGFMDVLSRSSGSTDRRMAIVNDGFVPGKDGKADEHVMWALVPSAAGN